MAVAKKKSAAGRGAKSEPDEAVESVAACVQEETAAEFAQEETAAVRTAQEEGDCPSKRTGTAPLLCAALSSGSLLLLWRVPNLLKQLPGLLHDSLLHRRREGTR